MTKYTFSLEPVGVPRVETRHRRIVTPLPAPGSIPTLKELERYEPESLHHELPVVWDRAEGHQVFDAYGNCWIDFTSGIFVANAGHAHHLIRHALAEQINHRLLHNYTFASEIRARLARKLVESSPPPLEKAFLLSTGSEATECALKLTRMYGRRLDPDKTVIVSFDGSFHGRTIGAQTMSGNPTAKEWIVHLDPDIYQLTAPFCQRCPWGRERYKECGEWCFQRGLEQLRNQGLELNRIAGFMVESYLAWGAIFYPDDYIRALRAWADAHFALVTFDEVQAGFGRTGKPFCFEHYGVEADLVCCGKGISSSLPLSAVLGRSEILDIPPDLSSTHSGNPLCCAAALANLEAIEKENLVAAANRTGGILESHLMNIKQRYPDRIHCILGRGLLYAVHLANPVTDELDIELADRVLEKAMQKGLLMVRTGRGTLKIGPPLSIPEEAVIEGVAVLQEAIDECLD
ncbi:MAG TPA: aspartate aminotransferase family protein [Dehalococcoidia bacterium]|nr:aspartate aminotransferase family protein [Dehalococcoidia bacterium]